MTSSFLSARKFILMAGVALALALPENASAAGFLFFGNSQPEAPATTGSIKPRPQPSRHRQQMQKAEKTIREVSKPQGPLVIAISINKQRMKVYDANGLFAETPISTGMAGHSTPMGVFSIIQKNKWHRSNIYSGAPMPYMQRITWSGIALHQGVLPGYPASHGCIRMPTDFAIRLWGWTRMGVRVIVTPEEITPAEFSHAKLIAQMLPPTPVAANSGADSSNAGVKIAKNPAAESPAESPNGSSPEHLKTDRLASALPSSPLDAQASAPRGAAVKSIDQKASDVRTADAGNTIPTRSDVESAPEKSERAETKTDSVVASTPSSDETIIAFDPAEDVPLAVMSGFAPKSIEQSIEQATEQASEKAADAASESTKTENAANKATDNTQGDRAETRTPAIAQSDKTAEAPALAAKAQDRLAAPSAASEPLGNIAAPASIVAGGATRPAEQKPADEPQKPVVAEKKRSGHIAVFISRKEGKLFVRQNFEPLFDVPVEIANADQPLGTHIFTARSGKDSAEQLHWSVVSLPVTSRKAEADAAKRAAPVKTAKGKKAAAAPQDATPAAALPSAGEALDRIAIPQDALQRIAMTIQPGGSIIISDAGLGGETGLGTDFIVPLRQ